MAVSIKSVRRCLLVNRITCCLKSVPNIPVHLVAHSVGELETVPLRAPSPQWEGSGEGGAPRRITRTWIGEQGRALTLIPLRRLIVVKLRNLADGQSAVVRNRFVDDAGKVLARPKNIAPHVESIVVRPVGQGG